MYNSLLSLFVNGVGATVGTTMYVVCEVLATCCCAFVVVLPFIIVWKIIQLFIG